MNKYIIILLVILSSCGSRKVNKTNIEEIVKNDVEKTIIDTSTIITNIDTNTKVLDSSEESEICIEPLDTTKPFTYDKKEFKNAVLKIRKHKNNISTQTSEKVSENRHNAVEMTVKDKSKTQLEIADKDIDKKESLLSYWWILLIIAACYAAYKVYDKNKYI